MAMSTGGLGLSGRSCAVENLTVQPLVDSGLFANCERRASRFFCRSLAGLSLHPIKNAAFLDRVLLLFGVALLRRTVQVRVDNLAAHCDIAAHPQRLVERSNNALMARAFVSLSRNN